MFPKQNRFGISICICNDRGEFVTVKTAVFLGVPSVPEAEVCELGFDKVSIELDDRLVADGILSKSNHQTEFGCNQCRFYLSRYPILGVSCTRKRANFVTHNLAQASQAHSFMHYASPYIIFILFHRHVLQILY